MKKRLILLAIAITLSLVYINVGLTQDNISLSISCTIPAIPGVNAPLIEEESIKTEADISTPSSPRFQKDADSQDPELIQQDLPQEEQGNKGQPSIVVLRTIYSR